MNKQKYNLQINAKDIIGMILEQRSEGLYNTTITEKNLTQKQSENYANIYTAIDNVPDAFVETKKGIENSIEKYLEILNEIQGIENEKFYREGFSDAIQLILECINNKHIIKNK